MYEKRRKKKNRPIPDSKHRIIGLVKQLRSANYGIKYANQASYIYIEPAAFVIM